MLITKFTDTIDLWINALNGFEFDQLLLKPGAESWSLGQLYIHLLNETQYFLSQVELCLQSNEHSSEQMIEKAKNMFRSDEFPDERAKGDPVAANNMQQPVDKSSITTALLRLKKKINLLGKRVLESGYTGKTQHPGLGYFNAEEWFQYAEMHMRHHLRQKRRLEEFLTTRSPATRN